jgi:hypothetical protein
MSALPSESDTNVSQGRSVVEAVERVSYLCQISIGYSDGQLAIDLYPESTVADFFSQSFQHPYQAISLLGYRW